MKDPKRCPTCGYTEEDKRIHGDHHLCPGDARAIEIGDGKHVALQIAGEDLLTVAGTLETGKAEEDVIRRDERDKIRQKVINVMQDWQNTGGTKQEKVAACEYLLGRIL